MKKLVFYSWNTILYYNIIPTHGWQVVLMDFGVKHYDIFLSLMTV